VKKGLGGGQLAQADPLTRDFERQVANLTAVNPYTGLTDRLLVAMADQAEMRLLHMYTTGDPNRNPVFAYFADPNYFLTDFPTTTCKTCINPAFAWNHGDIQPDIATTWLGFVGPGVSHLGETADIWTDHTDVRPTMLALLGLHDDYASDGRAIVEIIRTDAGRRTLTHDRPNLAALGAAYKQLTAPFGILSKASLRFATHAIVGGSAADDSAYTAAVTRIADWTARRDALAAKIGALLGRADGGRHRLDSSRAEDLIAEAWRLIVEVDDSAI
jgi:hypothetical protein